MKKKVESFKKRIVIGSIAVLFLLIGGVYFFVTNNNEENEIEHQPIIELLGEDLITLNKNEEYIEPGFIAKDYKDVDITDKVLVIGEVDINAQGRYVLSYIVQDKYGNISKPISREIVIAKPSEECDGDRFEVNKEELAENIKKEIKIHEQKLLSFEEDTCKIAKYLSPYIFEYYEEDEQPRKKEVNQLIKEIWKNRGN